MAFPDVPCVKGLPKLIRSVSSSRSGKRIMVNLEYADPFWQADIETAPMYPEQRASMAAFIDQANNGMTTILFAPDWLGVPQTYWEDRSNPAVTTSGNLVSITNGNQLFVNGVVNGLKLTNIVPITAGMNRQQRRAAERAARKGRAA